MPKVDAPEGSRIDLDLQEAQDNGPYTTLPILSVLGLWAIILVHLEVQLSCRSIRVQKWEVLLFGGLRRLQTSKWRGSSSLKGGGFRLDDNPSPPSTQIVGP